MTSRKPKKIKTAVNNYVNYYKKGIKSFSEIYIPETVISIDISDNPLFSSFEGLGSFSQMTTLKANGTRISSFKGASTQNSLLNLSLLNTPLSKEKNLSLMALMTFGSTLRNVNGKYLSQEVKNLALQIKPKALPYLERGYLISQVEPVLKVHLPGSNEDIIVDLNTDEFIKKEKLIQENDKAIQEMKKRLLELRKEKREKKASQVDQKKLIDSFIGPSPKKSHLRKNKTTTTKVPTTNNSKETTKRNPQAQTEHQKTASVDSPTYAANKQKTNLLNKSENKYKLPKTQKAAGRKAKIQEQNKQKEIEDNTNKSEESPISFESKDQKEDYENIFNFSDDERKEEEEESPNIEDIDASPISNKLNILPASDFPNDDELIDFGGESPSNQNKEQDIDQDLYNEMISDDENSKELLNKDSKNSNIENESGMIENGTETNEEEEYPTIVDNGNDDQNNIFNFSEDDEDDPDVTEMKKQMDDKPKNFLTPHSDFPSDDQMIDFNDDMMIDNDE